MKIIYFLIPVTVFIITYLVVNPKNYRNLDSPSKNSEISRRSLYEDLYHNGGLIIYAASNPSYSQQYLIDAENIQKNFRWAHLKIIPDTAVSLSELKNNSVIIIGTYKSNKILRELSPQLPIKFSDSSFLFNHQTFKDSSTTINLFYYNPLNKKKLCYIISGIEDRFVVNISSTRAVGDIRIMQNGLCSEMGFFKLDSMGNWVLDENRFRNFSDEKKIYNLSKNFSYTVYSKNIGFREVKKINEVNEASLKKIKQFFGKDFHTSKINFNIFDNFEDKGLITGNTQLSNINNKDSSVDIVVNNWIGGNDFSKAALFLLKKNFSDPRINFIEQGLSFYFSDNWRKEGYKFWASFIYQSGGMPELNEMLNNDSLEYDSYFFTDPLSASFVSFLINKYGKEEFIKEFTKWNIKNMQLEGEWKKYLAKLSSNYLRQVQDYKNNFPNDIPKYQKGFCFAHEGYDIYNGYLSRETKQSVEKMQSLGANSFSITPFTSMRDANKPVPLRFWEFAGAENDESLIYLSHLSKTLKMNVILKPQIYLGENSWPGNIEMTNKNDWQKFFHFYFNWISHYAMLAEMYKIPILCIGNELSKATVGHEEDWINMVKKIRRIYNGKIVYGPNWSSEFSKLTFWNYFDYIGLSEYFPLSDKNNPTDEELFHGAELVMNKIHSVQKKYDKPVIFTEVGFRSTGEPWKTALEKDTKNEISLMNQARCYNALFKAAYNQKWLAGMYWWKWPSYLAYGGGHDNEHYTPNNKPAEDIVKEWYSKIWN